MEAQPIAKSDAFPDDSGGTASWRNWQTQWIQNPAFAKQHPTAQSTVTTEQPPAKGESASTSGIPVTCSGCGVVYHVKRVRTDRYRESLCVSCRSAKGRASVLATFQTPTSTRAERIRANGLVNKRLKLGWFVKPCDCMACGKKKKKLDMHHPDYQKPGEVCFVCRACHMGWHYAPHCFAHVKPIDTGANRPIRIPHNKGGRKGPTGKAKGRHPLRRIVTVGVDGDRVVEQLACGHFFERPEDGRRPVQRRCADCPRLPLPASAPQTGGPKC